MRPRLKLVHVLFLLVTIGVLARLYHIDAPLMEYRIMRQNDNAALARNFHQEGNEYLLSPVPPQLEMENSVPPLS